MALWGARAPGVGAPCRGGAGVPPFAGPGLIAGRAWPVRRCRRVLGGLAWCRLVRGGGVPHPPSMRRVGVRRRRRLMVLVE